MHGQQNVKNIFCHTCQVACSINVLHLTGSPTTLQGATNYTLHLSNVTDPVDYYLPKILLLKTVNSFVRFC